KLAEFGHDLIRMDMPNKPEWEARTKNIGAHEEEFAALPTENIHEVTANIHANMANLDPTLPYYAMVTFGAGEHTNWVHRYFPTHHYGTLISARNGSMGYSIPSAVTASLNFPERRVVSVAGDGEFLMNGQEIATAAQYGAKPFIIVMDNQEYGTIRTHQERDYPGRVSGTQLKNPN